MQGAAVIAVTASAVARPEQWLRPVAGMEDRQDRRRRVVQEGGISYGTAEAHALLVAGGPSPVYRRPGLVLRCCVRGMALEAGFHVPGAETLLHAGYCKSAYSRNPTYWFSLRAELDLERDPGLRQLTVIIGHRYRAAC